MNEKFHTAIPVDTSIAVIAPTAMYTGMKLDKVGQKDAQEITVATLTSYQSGRIRTAEVVALNETQDNTHTLKRFFNTLTRGVRKTVNGPAYRSHGSKLSVRDLGSKLVFTFDAGIYKH